MKIIYLLSFTIFLLLIGQASACSSKNELASFIDSYQTNESSFINISTYDDDFFSNSFENINFIENNLMTNEQFYLQRALMELKNNNPLLAWRNFTYLLHYCPKNETALTAISSLAPKLDLENQAKLYIQQANS